MQRVTLQDLVRALVVKRIFALFLYMSPTGTDAVDWLDKNQLAELESQDRTTLCTVLSLNVSSFVQPKSVTDGDSDNTEDS